MLPLLHQLRFEAAVRSRGTSISTSPRLSVSTVLDRLPLRELPRLRPSGAWCRSRDARPSLHPTPPRTPSWSTSSTTRQGRSTRRRSPGPAEPDPRSPLDPPLTAPAAGAHRILPGSDAGGLTPTSVSVIMTLPAHPDGRATYTVRAIDPRGGLIWVWAVGFRRPGLHDLLPGNRQRRDAGGPRAGDPLLIACDKDHPGVVLWSIANGPESETEAAENCFRAPL